MSAQLSRREGEIVALIAAGKTTKEMSVELSIAESTVNWHVQRILTKLGASSRAEIVAIVLRERLLGDAGLMQPAPAPKPSWSARAIRIGVPLVVLISMVLLAGFVAAAGTALIQRTIAPAPPATSSPARPTTSASPRTDDTVQRGSAMPAESSTNTDVVSGSTDAPAAAPTAAPPVITARPPDVPLAPATTTSPSLPTVPSVPPAPSLPAGTLTPAPVAPPLPVPSPSIPLPIPSLPVPSLPH